MIKPRMKGESKSSFIIECRDSASTSLPILLTPTIYSPASFIRATVLLKYLKEMGKDYTIHGLRWRPHGFNVYLIYIDRKRLIIRTNLIGEF